MEQRQLDAQAALQEVGDTVHTGLTPVGTCGSLAVRDSQKIHHLGVRFFTCYCLLFADSPKKLVCSMTYGSLTPRASSGNGCMALMELTN